jgi:glutamyl-tRNA synthetase
VKVKLALPYLQKAGLASDPPDAGTISKVDQIIRAAGDRIKVGGDILDHASFFQRDDEFSYDEAAFDKRIRKPADATGLLRKLSDRLSAAEPFDAATVEKVMHDFVQAEGIAIGQIIHAMRVAVTGTAVGFGVFESVAVMGRAHTLARIDRALARL